MTEHSAAAERCRATDESSRTDEFTAATPEDRASVEQERDELKDFISALRFDEIKNGGWFVRLLAVSLGSYTKKVDWKYFQDKYDGVPPDAIVDQRINIAARYAAIGGGLSAGAYTAVIAATIGSLGGASPATVPAAVGTMMLDLAYISQLQIRLAYDIAVLYRVPVDVNDPDDLWKLVRVAFTIKGGELAREGAIKAVPALIRPLIKKFFSGATLSAMKGLPVIGKFLLQRNLIKIGIPIVGIPLAVILNRWTTVLAGKHARTVFRNEARVLEVARRLLDQSRHPQLLLWVSWLVIQVDEKRSDDEVLLMRHLTRLARERHEIVDEQLARLINIEPSEVWSRIASEGKRGDLSDVVDAAVAVAEIDGEINAQEQALLYEIRERSRGNES